MDAAQIVVGDYSETAAQWFSSRLLKPLVSGVKRREPMRTERFCRSA
jgi:hypothetical protein